MNALLFLFFIIEKINTATITTHETIAINPNANLSTPISNVAMLSLISLMDDGFIMERTYKKAAIIISSSSITQRMLLELLSIASNKSFTINSVFTDNEILNNIFSGISENTTKTKAGINATK